MTSIEELEKLFINLTEYEIPFGYENTLEKYLPDGYKKDSVGNYFYEIGESETLFTTHLDTFSKAYKKIVHVKDDNGFIGTDGKSILGGDNKLGTAILINMINENKPGTYYFFLGEEPLKSGGLYGSRRALAYNEEFFKKFKRCVAFDRREYGSIVTRQMGRNCCSMEFAEALAENLKKYSSIPWDKKGGFGYYTDTAVFMDVIPEVSNLSAGGFKEHHFDEYVNLKYTYAVLNAALKMDWESLPVVRELDEDEVEETGLKKFIHFGQNKLIEKLKFLAEIIDLQLTKDRKTATGRILVFSKWLEEVDLKMTLDDNNNIIVDGQKMNYDQFLAYIIKTYSEDIVGTYDYYLDEKNYEYLKAMMRFFGCKNPKEFKKKMGR